MVEWWTPSIHHWAEIISTVAFHFAQSPPSFRETSELGKRSRMKISVVAVLISQNFCCDAATNWSYISEQFDETWSSYLPSIPDRALNASDYLVADLGSFQTITLELASLPTDADVDSVFCPVGDNATQWPRDAIRAGPLVDCDADGITCTGGYAGSTCRAANGRANDPSAGSILLMQKLGTYWAKMSAHPAWAMYRFPSVPNARSITVRYELDGRYASELHGGNPCSNATNGDGYQCSLCIDYDGWNFGAPAGFYVLWSASGRSAWAITGPHMPPDMSEEEQDYGILDSPADLELRDDEELVLVFMVYNQYAGVDESAVDGASSCCTCTVGASNNKALMLQTVTIITRGAFSLPQEPRDDDGAVPRLMGADGEYVERHVRLDAVRGCINSDDVPVVRVVLCWRHTGTSTRRQRRSSTSRATPPRLPGVTAAGLEARASSTSRAFGRHPPSGTLRATARARWSPSETTGLRPRTSNEAPR